MRRIDTMTSDEILTILSGIASGDYIGSLCEDCPLHKYHNPCCVDNDMNCFQSVVYYLSEEICGDNEVRSWVIKNHQCPFDIKTEKMCDDCPDRCPLWFPDDPRNKEM